MASYDAFDHLLEVAFPDNPNKGVIAMISVYVDAAYSHPKDATQVHCLVGLVGCAEQWKRSRKEWNLELRKKSLDHFHMRDFTFARARLDHGQTVPTSSPYYGWTLEEMDTFFKRLARTISRWSNGRPRLNAFGSSIFRNDFMATLPDGLKDDLRCSSEYAMSAYVLIRTVALWARKEKYDGKILYVFASGDDEIGQLTPLFQYMTKQDQIRRDLFLHWLMPECLDTETAMREEPAIQMADTLCSSHRNMITLWDSNGRPDKIEPSMRLATTNMLTKNFSSFGFGYTQKELIEEYQDIVRYGKWTPKRKKLK